MLSIDVFGCSVVFSSSDEIVGGLSGYGCKLSSAHHNGGIGVIHNSNFYLKTILVVFVFVTVHLKPI
jgi:hypothetical protein